MIPLVARGGASYRGREMSGSSGEPRPPAGARGPAALQDEHARLLVALFRIAAHALNNPLQAALGGVELAALSGTGDHASKTENLGEARDALLEAAELVAALQDFARWRFDEPDEPDEPDERGPTDLTRAMTRCARVQAVLERHEDLELVFAGDPAAPLPLPTGALALALVTVMVEAARTPSRSLKLTIEPASSSAGAVLAFVGAPTPLTPPLVARDRGERIEVRAEGWAWRFAAQP